MKVKYLYISLTLGVGMVLALLWLVGVGATAQAAPAAELHVCPSGCAYTSIQVAVDAAQTGDVIKVAQGSYTDVHHIASLDTATFTATQIVAITKTITIQGGYTTSDWNTPDPTAHPTILDAQGQGRVLVITGTIAPTIKGLRITGGDAAGLGGFQWGDMGGGIYINAATAVISSNLVYSNTVGSNEGFGGGLGLIDSDATLNGNTVSSNVAHNGDGLYLRYSPAILSGNTISGNGDIASGWGGGLYLYSSNATLSGNTITGNTGGYGGGVSVQHGGATLNDNTVTNNDGYRGGGLFLYGGSNTVSKNVIIGNTASDQGGGVYLWSNSSTLVNTIVSDNHLSSGLGAGLYLDSASALRLLHTTIARNSGGDNSGVYVTGYEWEGTYYASTVVMTDTILVSHTAAIDQGVDISVTTDIDGDTRPQGAGFDIGADELFHSRIYVPLVMRSEQ
jgi:hypothetical protein